MTLLSSRVTYECIALERWVRKNSRTKAMPWGKLLLSLRYLLQDGGLGGHGEDGEQVHDWASSGLRTVGNSALAWGPFIVCILQVRLQVWGHKFQGQMIYSSPWLIYSLDRGSMVLSLLRGWVFPQKQHTVVIFSLCVSNVIRQGLSP